MTPKVDGAQGVAARRPERRDLRLPADGLFDIDRARELWESLPVEQRRDHFDYRSLPDAYRGGVVPRPHRQAGLEPKWFSVALSMRGLPEPMVWELAWLIHREIELGRSIHPSAFNSATSRLRVAVTAGGRKAREAESLLALTPEEWLHHVAIARVQGAQVGTAGDSVALNRISALQDVLVPAYHRGQWWELDVWNPQLDTRIPLRRHDPAGRSVVNFSRLTSDWLRGVAKLWLGERLDASRYSWSTVQTRVDNLKWLQHVIDEHGDHGPLLVAAPEDLRGFVRGLIGRVRAHRVTQGKNAGRPLGGNPVRQIMVGIEQFYQWAYDNRSEQALRSVDSRWTGLTHPYSVLFRPGDKPRLTNKRHDELVLEDQVMSQIAAGADVLRSPTSEGGFGDASAFNALMLLMRTGRRLNEILMMDFDPLTPLVGTTPDGGDGVGLVARLRYQQTKVDSSLPSSIPVDAEIVSIVHDQQEITRAWLAENGAPGAKPRYLFLARFKNRHGDRPYPAGTLNSLLGRLTEALDIRDSVGNPVRISKTHQFRHTKATSLLNAGVPLHVVMRYFGHVSADMTLHYAMTSQKVAEQEFMKFQKYTSDGKPLEMSAEDLFDVLHLDQRADRVLPNGWCMLPPKQTCDRGNACLTCNKFVTDSTHAPQLEAQRDATRQLIAQRKKAFVERYGVEMSADNVWLEGREREVDGLHRILLSIRKAPEGSAVRGAGAPFAVGEANEA